jgi:hypothetical protein
MTEVRVVVVLEVKPTGYSPARESFSGSSE